MHTLFYLFFLESMYLLIKPITPYTDWIPWFITALVWVFPEAAQYRGNKCLEWSILCSHNSKTTKWLTFWGLFLIVRVPFYIFVAYIGWWSTLTYKCFKVFTPPMLKVGRFESLNPWTPPPPPLPSGSSQAIMCAAVMQIILGQVSLVLIWQQQPREEHNPIFIVIYPFHLK